MRRQRVIAAVLTLVGAGVVRLGLMFMDLGVLLLIIGVIFIIGGGIGTLLTFIRSIYNTVFQLILNRRAIGWIALIMIPLSLAGAALIILLGTVITP